MSRKNGAKFRFRALRETDVIFNTVYMKWSQKTKNIFRDFIALYQNQVSILLSNLTLSNNLY